MRPGERRLRRQRSEATGRPSGGMSVHAEAGADTNTNGWDLTCLQTARHLAAKRMGSLWIISRSSSSGSMRWISASSWCSCSSAFPPSSVSGTRRTAISYSAAGARGAQMGPRLGCTSERASVLQELVHAECTRPTRRRPNGGHSALKRSDRCVAGQAQLEESVPSLTHLLGSRRT